MRCTGVEVRAATGNHITQKQRSRGIKQSSKHITEIDGSRMNAIIAFIRGCYWKVKNSIGFFLYLTSWWYIASTVCSATCCIETFLKPSCKTLSKWKRCQLICRNFDLCSMESGIRNQEIFIFNTTKAFGQVNSTCLQKKHTPYSRYQSNISR